MPRINNPLVPAEVHERALLIARAKQHSDKIAAAVLLIPFMVSLAIGALLGWGQWAFALPVAWIACTVAAASLLDRREQAFFAAHPDLTLDVPEHVRVAYLRFSADAKAVTAADVPVAVQADIDAARETAEQLLVACHSERPEDPDEAHRIQAASTELMRLADEADALHTSVRQRTEAIKARTDMVDGRDISEILAQARTRSLSAANDAVEAETQWLAEHLDAVRDGDPLDDQD